MAAGGNNANAAKAAKLAALSNVLNTFNGKNNMWYSNQNLNALNRKVNNAAKNVNLNNNARARLNDIKSRIKAAMNAKAPAPTRANLLLRQAATQQEPNLSAGSLYSQEKTIKAPNNRNVVVIRANNKARWNFKNPNNATKYNLNNRNGNTPKIRNVNVNTGNLIKQGN